MLLVELRHHVPCPKMARQCETPGSTVRCPRRNRFLHAYESLLLRVIIDCVAIGIQMR